MKKSSTQSISRLDGGQQFDVNCEPRKQTLDFIRNFARACRSVPVSTGNGSLSTIVLN